MQTTSRYNQNALWIHSKICRWNIKKSHSWARRLGAAIKNHLKKWVEYKQQIYYCLRWQEDIVRILFSSRFIIRVIPTKFFLPTVFLMIKITILTKLELFDYMHISKWTTQHFTLFLSSAWLSADEWMQSFRILVLSIRISVIMELPVVTDFNDIPIEVENHTLCYKSSTSSVWPTNSRIQPRCLNTVAGWTGFVWTISCKDQLIEARNAPFA